MVNKRSLDPRDRQNEQKEGNRAHQQNRGRGKYGEGRIAVPDCSGDTKKRPREKKWGKCGEELGGPAL